MALVLVLFGVMVSYLNPMVSLIDAWSDSKAGEGRLLELKTENASLQQQLEQAENPLTLEREARKLGLIREGEKAYVVEGLDD